MLSLKEALYLRKRKARETSSYFLVEGTREVRAVATSKWHIDTLFYCDTLLSVPLSSLLGQQKPYTVSISAKDFARFAYRDTSGGVIAVVCKHTQTLAQLTLSTQPLLLVLDAIEKPGNLGAIFRIAALSHVDAILITSQKTDIYNPNVVRNSLGGVFSVPWVEVAPDTLVLWMRQKNISLIALSPDAQQPYTSVDMRKGTAFVLGAEAQGLSTAWRTRCHKYVQIPMPSKRVQSVDSLNVSSVAAIVVYESLRQRSTHT